MAAASLPTAPSLLPPRARRKPVDALLSPRSPPLPATVDSTAQLLCRADARPLECGGPVRADRESNGGHLAHLSDLRSIGLFLVCSVRQSAGRRASAGVGWPSSLVPRHPAGAVCLFRAPGGGSSRGWSLARRGDAPRPRPTPPPSFRHFSQSRNILPMLGRRTFGNLEARPPSRSCSDLRAPCFGPRRPRGPTAYRKTPPGPSGRRSFDRRRREGERERGTVSSIVRRL